jgi:hypothetical protein
MHPLIEHLITKGAAVSGGHSVTEIQSAEAQLSIQLPREFIPYFTSFHGCQVPDTHWDFFSIRTCIERTLVHRKHYRRIYGAGFEVPIESVFAFCDYLIDAPTYFVVAEPELPLFGFILGTHSEDGWIVGKNLADFLEAFQREWEIGIISNEKSA